MVFKRIAPLLLILQVIGFGAQPPTGSASAAELVLHRWSGDLNVPDPVACAVDPQGRVYVAATTRRKVADLDIREHPQWTASDVGLTSVEDKRAFFHRELAPGRTSRPRGGLDDHNGDGSIDWRDLTVHSERIYQLRDTNGDGTADTITVFAEGFNTEVTGIAAGVMWHDGWLYATIAPDLWRFRDVDDDGVADIREVVVHGFGVHIAYGGHDMHGLSVGPDGRIYWSIGDKGSNVTSKEGKRFVYPNEGAVFRVEPDGSGYEVYARGLRNPQEPAFDEWGNLFVVDNDADFAGERERLVFIAEGSDSGWRCNFQYMGEMTPWMRERLWELPFEGQPAYLLPPLAYYSDGPAGFRFDPGTGLGAAQRRHFVLTEFPSGLIRGFTLEPQGASFRLAGERVLSSGVMGIGLSWHPDGSLMMVDWQGGYPLNQTGGVWRVDAVAGHDPQRRSTQALLQRGMSGRTVDDLRALLAHPDQRVRLQAQFELVKRAEAEALLAAAGDRTVHLLTRVHGLWGYGQLLRHQRVSAEPLLAFLADPESEVRSQTLKVLGDAQAVRAHAGAVVPLLRDGVPRVRYHAALAIGKGGAPQAVDELFHVAAREGDDPTLRHAAVMGLAGSATAAQLAARVDDESLAVRRISVVALRRQRSAAVRAFLQDREVTVVEEAARAIHDDESIADALPDLARLLEPTVRSDVVGRRALNANFRLGTTEGARRLLAVALSAESPFELRREAIALLRVWNEPPPLDVVDGWARTIRTVPIGELLTAQLDALLALPEPALKTLALEVMIAHAVAPTPKQLREVLTDAAAPAQLRGQALRLMASRHQADPGYATMLWAALDDAVADPLFSFAVELLAEQDPAGFIDVARRALQQRGLPVRQQVLKLLAAAGSPAADAVLHEQARAWQDGMYSAGLYLDLMEALAARAPTNPHLAAALQAYAGSPEATARRELTAGGSPLAGRDIALNHLGGNCLACHRLESSDGSSVGPSLRSIGRERDAASLLQSLLDPGAHLTPGFGFVTVALAGGESVAGGLWEETPERVTVRLLDGTQQTVRREQIDYMTPPVSIMPPMEGILTPREIRDLVAYLQTLRQPSAGSDK
jgi:quinoprotein glucose dehydrogenase